MVLVRELRNKVAVVTGGGSGIGRGMAHAFAGEGMNVVIGDIEREPAEAVAAELRERGVRAIAVQADVAEPASVDGLAARGYDEFGAVHVLCNNAGVFIGGALADTPPEEWAWLIAVNLMGVVNGVRAFLPRLRLQGGQAHIVNTGSVSGLYPTPNQGAYTATKYAVVGYTERLREELEQEQIGVSVLCPSGVQTRITQSRRNRQQQFGGPIFSEPLPAARERRPDVLDPMEVGALVVRGIKENRLYIHTHLSFKPRCVERFARILADFVPLEAGTSVKQ